MQFLFVRPPSEYMGLPVFDVPLDGQRHGSTSHLLRYGDQPWVAGLASFVATAIVLLPIEYETAIRSLMMFLSSRRY